MGSSSTTRMRIESLAPLPKTAASVVLVRGIACRANPAVSLAGIKVLAFSVEIGKVKKNVEPFPSFRGFALRAMKG